MTLFLVLTLSGAAIFWLVGPQSKFSLHFSIYMALLIAVSLIEIETKLVCVADDLQGDMLCQIITRLR